MIVEWHPAAVDDLARIDVANQRRIKTAIDELAALDDARQRLVPYTATLKGFWKLRVGDYRLVCELAQRRGQVVLIIHLAHRSIVYAARSIRTAKTRRSR